MHRQQMKGETKNRAVIIIAGVISVFPQVGQVFAFSGIGDLQYLHSFIPAGYMKPQTAVNRSVV